MSKKAFNAGNDYSKKAKPVSKADAIKKIAKGLSKADKNKMNMK
jgi:hypothetical protein